MTVPFKVVSIAAAAVLAVGLGGCADDSSKLERATGPSGDRSKSDVRQGLGGRTQEQGSLFGPGGLLGSKAEKRDDTGTGVAVNAYLWRASLDTINFIPLVSADPFGGVIITDWYTPPETPDERFKMTIYILDRQLRADGLKISVFRQARRGAEWVDVPVATETAVQLENAVLTRARQLRVDQAAR
jgi:hypothetical protein